MIRLTVPSIEEADLAAVRDALSSGFLVQGARVRAFEACVAELLAIPHVVVVSSGTAALHLALSALGTGPGDLVVTTAYSWIATANVIELCGAQPVFVDIRPDTFNMDPPALAAVLAKLGRNSAGLRQVRAIMPVHCFGQMADMPKILQIALEYGIPVIEDAACALGAAQDHKQAGTWGEMGAFSLHPRKNITTGEGGIIVTRNHGLARKVRALRNHGQDPDSPTPDFVLPGYNYRMTEFQAALGSSQLKRLPGILANRCASASRYAQLFAGSRVESPATPPGSSPIYQSYVCRLPAKMAVGRAALIGRLRDQGIETGIGTLHMPMTSYYRQRYGYRPGDFPVTDEVSARSLALPMYDRITPEEQELVARAILAEIG